MLKEVNMGSSKDKFRDFAVAFWKTSKQDLERTEDVLKKEYYLPFL